ncbi:acyl-CoA hydrolase [Salinisphaera sp. PC39]|uniref:acyl-CoA thioesterase n=1 Tax=Salinisphaera sp. PC39 TaxID=1304156 RepID=UPI003341D35B
MSDQAEGRPVAASAIREHIYKVFPNDMNSNATVFGGMVMATIDRISLVVAERHSGRVCVTVSVDDIHFLAPARTGETLIFSASCNRAWGSSMEIGCRVKAEDSMSGEQRHIVSAYSTFVALDDDHKPVTVRPVRPETDIERRRYDEAALRRDARLKHAKALEKLRGGQG